MSAASDSRSDSRFRDQARSSALQVERLDQQGRSSSQQQAAAEARAQKQSLAQREARRDGVSKCFPRGSDTGGQKIGILH